MQQPLRFLDTDVGGPPAPGWYLGTVTTVDWRRSAHENRMVHVVLALDAVRPPYDRVADYFVLEGASPRGLAYSRKRLVALFHAGSLCPQPGDEIRPGDLVGLTVQVKLVHELWRDSIRLQIVGYRPQNSSRQTLDGPRGGVAEGRQEPSGE